MLGCACEETRKGSVDNVTRCVGSRASAHRVLKQLQLSYMCSNSCRDVQHKSTSRSTHADVHRMHKEEEQRSTVATQLAHGI